MCDDGSGQATFDLTTFNNTINGGSIDTVTWFTDSGLTTPVVTENAFLTGSTTVYAQVTDTATGCSDTAAVALTINPLPNVTNTSMNVCDDGSNQGTFDVTTLNNTVNGGTGNNVIWYTDNTLSTLVTPNNAFLTGSTTVYVQVTDPVTGCADTAAIQLTIDPQITITANPVATICLGDALSLTATGSGNGTITWYSDPAGTVVIGTGSPFTPTIPGIGTFTVYVRETGTCASALDSIVVIVGGVTAVINADPITGAIPLNVNFDGSGSSGIISSYLWDFGNGNTGSGVNPTHTYPTIGEYLVQLIVTDGVCYDTAYVTIITFGESEILIPNVFTPNGDNFNDVFTVKSVNLESIEGVIYNRWGQMMFSWDHIKGYWDGTTLSGAEAPDGTYFYIIQAKGLDGEEYFKKGGFSLIR